MITLLRSIALVLAWNWLAALSAAEFPNSSESFRITRWTSEDGLPQNKVQCLLQSKDVYIWIGTHDGLARFDGDKFTVLDQGNVPGLTRDSITSAVEGPDGSVWFTSMGGVLQIKDRKLTHHTTQDGLSHNRTWRMCATRHTGVWVVANDGINRTHEGRFSHTPPGIGIQDDTPAWIGETPAGEFLITSKTGFQRFDPATERFTDFLPPGLPTGLVIRDARFLPSGETLLATQTGLYWWKENQWRHYTISDRLSDDFVHRILKTSAGEVWVLTISGGLHHFENERFVRLDLGARKDPFAVDCLLSDFEGTLWVGTSSGLFKVQPRQVRSYGAREGLPHEKCFSVCEGKDGSVWVGSDHGLCRIRNDKVETYTLPDNPQVRTVESVWPDRSGDIWFSVYRSGLYRLREDKVVNITQPLGINCYGVGGIYQDRAGAVWFGSSDGVLKLDGDKHERLDIPREKDDSGGNAFLQDRNGSLWIANARGLHQWKNGDFNTLTTTNGMSRNSTSTLHEDSEGVI